MVLVNPGDEDEVVLAVSKDTHLQNNSIYNRFLEIRPASRDSHFEIFKVIFESGRSSMNGIVQLLGLRPQNVHARLQRLSGLSLLFRDKHRGQSNLTGRSTTEYYYSLHPDVSLEEAKEFIDTYPKQDFSKEVSLANDTIERINQGETEEAVSLNLSKSAESFQVEQSKSSSLVEMLLDKFPEFDPSWNEDVKARWLALFEKLIELSRKEND